MNESIESGYFTLRHFLCILDTEIVMISYFVLFDITDIPSFLESHGTVKNDSGSIKHLTSVHIISFCLKISRMKTTDLLSSNAQLSF